MKEGRKEGRKLERKEGRREKGWRKLMSERRRRGRK